MDFRDLRGVSMQLPNKKRIWLKVLAPVLGLASLAWFLVRVLPKPSRAAYPCQQAAFPLASGFVVWLAGLFGARCCTGNPGV